MKITRATTLLLDDDPDNVSQVHNQKHMHTRACTFAYTHMHIHTYTHMLHNTIQALMNHCRAVLYLPDNDQQLYRDLLTLIGDGSD